MVVGSICHSYEDFPKIYFLFHLFLVTLNNHISRSNLPKLLGIFSVDPHCDFKNMFGVDLYKEGS